jgi:hypothetical protein
MRRCRYRQCGQSFWPKQPHYYFCSWACHQAHYADDRNDYRGHQRSRDSAYDRGYTDGLRSGPMNTAIIPAHIWRGLLLFSHPDKWQGEPGLLTLANDVTRWLLQHRPREEKR